ncbi:hypothetical protein BU52_23090 [Streptomyces toyocaensis]|uniref:Lipoprotein n=1 Tax=Streptomyces toyocaensis TaxID=55952 RepID=A0A081XN06_STRTO|nr:hypothetical protein [Streptomyces toyocaensis]KES04929.1 hypothetical protein BU52_23090 [Streptomyces toyocaensis]
MHTITRPRPTGLARRLTVLIALTSLTLLTACDGESESSGEAGSKDVASVTREDEPDDGKKEPGQPAKAERPLIRPDTSEEEEWRLVQVYYDCLAKQGLKMAKNHGGEYEGTYKGILEQDPAKITAANKVCGGKEPETLPERAARNDPEYHDKYDKWLTCMRSHGLKVQATPDEPGVFAFEEGLPPESKAKWVKKCEAEAFVVN